MLFKYNDSKVMSKEQMKKVLGGLFEPASCTATINCPSGRSYTCAGNTFSYEGSTLGCSAQDGDSATCYYKDEAGVARFATVNCRGQMGWSSVA